ncbi:MAG TPA: hypothetical protein VMV09_06085 [Candidatus Saccharimonadales bacterium]|nr:hypothetical protein [Candidatus Saccharimonadales bacterium]
MTAQGATPTGSVTGAPEVAVLIVSCDKYYDLWEPFCTFMSRHWPDCPYRVFLLANHMDWSHDGVTTLRVGPDRSWSDSLRTAIQRLGVAYVLTIQDDFLLQAPVSTEAVVRAVGELHQRGGAYLRLVPTLVPSWRWIGRSRPDAVAIPPGSPYRISNQASVWRSDALLGLLRPGESPWEMEIWGSERTSKEVEGFFSATAAILRYHPHGAVIRGKWSRSAARRCRDAGVWQTDRGVQSVAETWQQAAAAVMFNLAMAVAPRLLWRVTLARYGSGIGRAQGPGSAAAAEPAGRAGGTGGEG